MNNRRSTLYYKAPDDLKRSLSQSAEQYADQNTRNWVKWGSAVAAVLLLAISVRTFTVSWFGPSSEDLLTQEVLSSHVRSMMASHLTDVVSSDRHTVKPWFNGRLDFSPRVIDLAADGFKLLGGRLDYVASRPVAALIYQHEKHVINLLTWPATGIPDMAPRLVRRQGFHLFHWVADGMQYWAISDLNLDDLRAFTEQIQKR